MGYRICVAILLGFCLGLLGCESVAISELQSVKHKHSLSIISLEHRLQLLDRKLAGFESSIKQLEAEFGTADAMFQAFADSKQQHEQTAKEMREVIEHHKKAIEELGNMVASAAKPNPPSVGTDQQSVAKKLGCIRVGSGAAAQTAPISPSTVAINPADTKPLKVTPIRCPTGKCPKR